LVTTPTAGPRDDRCRTRPGPATHAGRDEDPVGADQCVPDIVQRLLGGRTADLRLRPGAEALGHAPSQLDASAAERLLHCLDVGVGDNEVNALQVRSDHVVDGVAASAPDAYHQNAWILLAVRWRPEIDCHVLPRSLP
jgi:hypothetical protein